MNNVQLDANFAMNVAAMADQRAFLALQTCGTLAKAQMRADRWSRDLKINQEKAKYRIHAVKNPSHILLMKNLILYLFKFCYFCFY